MDSVTDYKELLALIGFVATIITTYFTTLRQMDRQIQGVKEKLREEQRIAMSALAKKVEQLERRAVTRSHLSDTLEQMEEKMALVVKAEILSNNTTLTSTIVSQLSHIIDDKLTGLRRQNGD